VAEDPLAAPLPEHEPSENLLALPRGRFACHL